MGRIYKLNEAVGAGEAIVIDNRSRYPHGVVIYIKSTNGNTITFEGSVDGENYAPLGSLSLSAGEETHVDYTGWQGRYPFIRLTFSSDDTVTVWVI